MIYTSCTLIRCTLFHPLSLVYVAESHLNHPLIVWTVPCTDYCTGHGGCNLFLHYSTAPCGQMVLLSNNTIVKRYRYYQMLHCQMGLLSNSKTPKIQFNSSLFSTGLMPQYEGIVICYGVTAPYQICFSPAQCTVSEI